MVPLFTSKRKIPKSLPVAVACGLLAAGVALDAVFEGWREGPTPPMVRIVPAACDPSAVPVGTIYFCSRSQVIAMAADGSKRMSLPLEPRGAPSALVYGDDPLRDRWWLSAEEDGRCYLSIYRQTIAHRELFACRLDPGAPGGVRRIGLTELFGRILIVNAFPPRWSNDGRDSFVSFCGCDLAEALEQQPDGTEALDPERVGQRTLYRVRINGPEFHAAVQAGEWTPETDDRLEDWGPAAMPVDWSPSGEAFVTYAIEEDSRLLLTKSQSGIEILHLAESGTYLGSSLWGGDLRWSPDGRCILLHCGTGWWTIGAKPGCTPQRLVDWASGPCVWSPDGNFALGRRYAASQFRRVELVAWRSIGSEALVLAGGDNLHDLGEILGWVGNERYDRGGDFHQSRL